ncbi:DnaJ-domain-containing protein [Lophium mytilinum]|uniref:DnaJ-domain-containing protein n=1 Tax=Lophium mytilinum TaxID=390894 RepID=A0A6A6QCJ3_9PEZI|nr:DnaJ-domain-containing protein [Lophium mytilinum]
MSGPSNPYAVLDLPHDVDEKVIRSAYHRLALLHHPDRVRSPNERSDSEGKFREIQHAYDVLKDSTKRAKLNRNLGQWRQGVSSQRSASASTSSAPVDVVGFDLEEFLKSLKTNSAPCQEEGKTASSTVDPQTTEERQANDIRDAAALAFAEATEMKKEGNEAVEEAANETGKARYTGGPKSHRYLNSRKGTPEHRTHTAATAAAYDKTASFGTIAYKHYGAAAQAREDAADGFQKAADAWAKLFRTFDLSRDLIFEDRALQNVLLCRENVKVARGLVDMDREMEERWEKQVDQWSRWSLAWFEEAKESGLSR